jgi:hypothetical protein
MAKFTVKWTDFTVLKKHDVDRDKPYLWVFGIVIDANSIVSEEYVIRRTSSSDNLGQKFKKGDSVPVSSSLDISCDVTPLLDVAAAGVIVVAWENAMTKDSVIADAYDKAADEINDFVTDLVAETLKAVGQGQPLDTIDFEPTEDQMRDLRADIEAEVRDTIKSGWSVFQMVPDHNIATKYRMVLLEEPFEECLDWRFIKKSTDYNLEGDLAYTVDAPPPSGPPPGPNDIPVKYQEPKPTTTR